MKTKTIEIIFQSHFIWKHKANNPNSVTLFFKRRSELCTVDPEVLEIRVHFSNLDMFESNVTGIILNNKLLVRTDY